MDDDRTSQDASQVLDVMRDVLIQHMDDQQALDDYRVQSATYIGRNSGRLISDNDIISGHDVPGGLRITMRSGAEYDLTLTEAEQSEGSEDE